MVFNMAKEDFPALEKKELEPGVPGAEGGAPRVETGQVFLFQLRHLCWYTTTITTMVVTPYTPRL